MNPARAMGTFLRVWRRQWAGLSRGQLAIAVSSLCGEGGGVTTDIVREWENGQPPRTAPRLNALIAVMRRHPCGNPPGMGGMSEVETDQFRKAVFTAVVSRHYPELFEEGNTAYRTDVREIAERIYGDGAGEAPPVNIVDLVASIDELEQALRDGPRPGVSRAQERRQRAALVYLRHTLANCHARSGRLRQAAATFAANAEFVQAHFGPRGLGGGVSVQGQRLNEAHVLATMEQCAKRPADGASRLLETSESP